MSKAKEDCKQIKKSGKKYMQSSNNDDTKLLLAPFRNAQSDYSIAWMATNRYTG